MDSNHDKIRTILIVDDEVLFCRLFQRHFTRQGYKVLTAGDGVEALELFDKNPASIELVVTDIAMPQMSGDELIQKLRGRNGHLPIIGITGHQELKEKLADHDSGAYYYVAKPIEDLVLMEPIVRNALRVLDYETKIGVQRRKEHQIARLLRQYILQGPLRTKPKLELEAAVEAIERTHVDGQSMRPSGDYAEWFERSDDEAIFYLADASGHDDIVASFTICLSNMVLHRCHHQGRPGVEEILRFIESAFDELRKAGVWEDSRFFTFFLGCLDLTTGDLSYVSAGHPEAFLVRNGNAGPGKAGLSERLQSTCALIGHISRFDLPIQVKRLKVSPGDLLFLYSDGACEPLEDEGSKQSGIDRLAEMVERFAAEPPGRVVAGVRDLLAEALGPAGFDDDTTLMAIRVQGATVSRHV